MKTSIITLLFAFVFTFHFAQEAAGKAEYDRVISGWEDYSMGFEKGCKLLIKSFEKGYDPACKRLMPTSMGTQVKSDAMQKCADRGDLECIHNYVGFHFDERTTNQQVQNYLAKAIEAGYEPTLFLLATTYEKEKSLEKAIPIYQKLADKGKLDAVYKLAILREDAKTAFEAIKDVKNDTQLYDPLSSGEAIYKAAMQSNNQKFILDVATVFNEKAVKSGVSHNSDRYRADDLYIRLCEMGNGEGCYQRGLDFLPDYRDRENGIKWFDKAEKLGYKVPEKEMLKMKSAASSEEIEAIAKREKAEDERNAKLAKQEKDAENYREYKNAERERIIAAGQKTKTNLSKQDMDRIISGNSPSASQQSEADRHRREMEKQARDTEKITNGTWNGH